MPKFTYPDYLPEGFDPSSNSIQTGGFTPAPPPDTTLDEDGVDRALNGFIADKQAILYDGDDAFHGKTGYDALEAAPAINDRLSDLRQEALDSAPNDFQRALLGERLDAQLDEARDGIGRRVEQAGIEAQLQTLDDRYAMLQAEAAYDHNDPGKIEGLAMVAEQTAAHEARLGDHDDPDALATERRNGVWQSAIEANLAKGQPREALALYDRSKGSLGEAMTTEMKDVATDVEAEDWVRRQEGAPTQETADAALADPDLSPAARLRAYQKVQADIAGRENARVAEVERLDAAVTTATKDLATNPSTFKRGTLASLADGYQRADETDTAACCARKPSRRASSAATRRAPRRRSSASSPRCPSLRIARCWSRGTLDYRHRGLSRLRRPQAAAGCPPQLAVECVNPMRAYAGRAILPPRARPVVGRIAETRRRPRMRRAQEQTP